MPLTPRITEQNWDKHPPCVIFLSIFRKSTEASPSFVRHSYFFLAGDDRRMEFAAFPSGTVQAVAGQTVNGFGKMGHLWGRVLTIISRFY